MKNKVFFTALLLTFSWSIVAATNINRVPVKTRVNSIRSLSKIMAKIEKVVGKKARNTTAKLQAYLEDVYISQGTTIILKGRSLAITIKNLIKAQKSRKYIKKLLLKLYQKGKFH